MYLRHSGRSSTQRDLRTRKRLNRREESQDCADERVDGIMPMISSDLVMHLFPQSLDWIVIRRIRWQKVQDDAATGLLQVALHASRLVDDVVVQHDVQFVCSAVSAIQMFEEQHEHRCVLALSHAVHDAPSSSINFSLAEQALRAECPSELQAKGLNLNIL